MEKKLNIPDHWEQISLVDDFIYVPTGVENYDGKKLYYSTGSIKTQGNSVEGEYSFIDRPSRANRIAKKGDVLQARMKDTNKALLIDQGLDGALFSTGFFQVRPYNNTYSSKLLYYYLFSNSFLNEKNDLCSGSTQSALNDMQAKKLYVPLPPLAEQYRIVDKIESLFSEVDSSIENLKIAKEQLKRYRQSVLKSAFDGKLTVAWRAANRDKLETAETLMERIKVEREAAYASKSRKPKELLPLTSNEIGELPELPEGWSFVKLGAVIEEPKYGTSKKCDYETNGIGVLRIPNIADGVIDAQDLKFALFTDEEIDQYRLKSGDLLTIRSNGSVNLVGKTALVMPSDESYLYAGYLIRLRPYQVLADGKYLHYVLASHQLRKQIEQKAKSTSGVNNINTGEIQGLVIPFMQLEEQHQIVNEIESRLSEADMMEHTIDESLIKAEKMRQSILKKAFEGKLVTQNLNEESVRELLQRTKEEKIKYQKEQKAEKKNAMPKVEKKKMEILEILKKHEGWVSAQDIFEQFTNDKDTDTIEGFYQKLRVLLNDDVIEVRRESGVDWFRAVKAKG